MLLLQLRFDIYTVFNENKIIFLCGVIGPRTLILSNQQSLIALVTA